MGGTPHDRAPTIKISSKRTDSEKLWYYVDLGEADLSYIPFKFHSNTL